MKRVPMFCFCVLCLGGSLWADDADPSMAAASSQQPVDVAKQIQELKQKKQALQGRRDYAARRAARLSARDWSEYQGELAKQELWDREIDRIDQEIEQLEKKP